MMDYSAFDTGYAMIKVKLVDRKAKNAHTAQIQFIYNLNFEIKLELDSKIKMINSNFELAVCV